MSQLDSGDLLFSVTFDQPQSYVEVFVRQNGIQNVAQNIVDSAVANGDGTFSYRLIRPASRYAAGDEVITRFYSYVAGQPGVFTPGPAQSVWAETFVYDETCQ
jgi:hypothetical protein